jgi:hypothetical protein
MTKKICPILMLLSLRAVPGVDSPKTLESIIICKEERCAWWQTFYPGQPEEHSQCAVQSIGDN